MDSDQQPMKPAGRNTSMVGFHLCVHYRAISSGIYRPNNQSDVHGMILAMLRAHDPVISESLHQHGMRKPWSFSRAFFDGGKLVPDSPWVHVREGTAGRFYINTMSLDVYEAIAATSMGHRQARLNDIVLGITDIDCTRTDFASLLPTRDLQITFHTPTFFRERDDRHVTTYLDLSKLISFQCDAVAKTGLISAEPKRLYGNIAILSQSTALSNGMLHEQGKNIVWPGFVGKAVLRCTSDDRALLEEFTALMLASQFTGVGSRTSAGFGHASVEILFNNEGRSG
nr:CRISPR system precrRNA processing endoribonuclease RAMP protein Cas6 [Candidatus Sigynarchaeum springense]